MVTPSNAPILIMVVLLVLHGRLTTATWCVARSDASREALQTALDYACSAGADCAPLQPIGLCFFLILYKHMLLTRLIVTICVNLWLRDLVTFLGLPLLRKLTRVMDLVFILLLQVLKRHSVAELVVSDGGCLQAILPPDLEEYQRLRCRVAFHALSFRQEVQELATKILLRLRAPGRPFIAYDPRMTRDALAYHGCAELFQDVHTELIQHKRLWMLKRGIVKGNLTVDSNLQRLNGSCPLMPEEIGIILRAYGYSWDPIIYISGGEVFGGQKKLIPFHAIFENVVDRTSLTTPWELNKIYGREANLVDKYPKAPPSAEKEMKYEAWKTSGQRPRPLPPPPARPKSYHIEGWWGWVAESDNEPESTVIELRTNAHKLLWEAIDYMVCVEADVFVPGFDRDGKGRPSFASLVMGHRLYQSATAKSFRLDRKEIAKHMEDISDNLYEVNQTWIKSVRSHMSKSLLDGLTEESKVSKSLSFLIPSP